MEEYLDILRTSVLFSGLNDEEIISILHCLSAEKRNYAKGKYVLSEGEQTEALGLVLSGSLLILNEDFWGNRNILVAIGPGEIFAESYACSEGAAIGINALTQDPCTILFLEVQRVLSSCSTSCNFHNRLIRNLVSILAAKNLYMNEKLQHITQRTTRDKLLSFLSVQSHRHGKSTFEIRFNRQQMADYLSVDRSAMSNELCKLRDEGVLKFDRNRFELLTTE